MDFDSLLVNYLGELGKYQVLILLFVASAAVNSSLNNLDYIFTGTVNPFRCDVGDAVNLSSRLAFDELLRLSSPVTPDGDPNACLFYRYNYSQLTIEEARTRLNMTDRTEIQTEKCYKWIFNQEEHTTTIASDWNLVCDRGWLVASTQAAYFVGLFTGVIGGFFSDRYGRRPASLGCLILLIINRVFLALSPNVYVFIALRFLMSTITTNWYIFLSIIAMESVGPNKRTLAGSTPYIFWSVGYVLLAGLAYVIRNWRTRNLVFLVFTLPYLLHFCFLNESVRWLKAQNKTEEATNIIERIARINKKDLPSKCIFDWLKPDQGDTAEQKESLLSLFKSWFFIKITLLEIFIWMTVNAVYYGLTFYLPNLGGNTYLNTVISGALEVPAILYVYLTLDTRFGRRLNACSLFLITGIVLLLIILVPKEITWLRLTLAQIGRFSISGVFSIIFIATPEVFPTRIRITGFGVCSSASSFASVISPYLAGLDRFGAFLPPLLFGGLSITAGFLYLLLPETRGKALKDFNLQDVSDQSTQPPTQSPIEITDTAKTETESLREDKSR